MCVHAVARLLPRTVCDKSTSLKVLLPSMLPANVIHQVPGSHTWGDNEPYSDGKGGTRIPAEDIDYTIEGICKLNQDDRFVVPAEAAIREIDAVPRPVKRGEVHFHHGLMWHASPKNRSAQGRRAFAIHFMRSDTRYFANGGETHARKHSCDVSATARLYVT
jgi:ectoine hydroxylase-related dioxygenase (phytanoyl-CoA dioxygenase family)